MIEINGEISNAVGGPRWTLEVRGGSVAQPVHRNDILGNRVAVAIEITDFDLQRAGVVARIANLAFDQHVIAASHQPTLVHVNRLCADQRVEYVAREP